MDATTAAEFVFIMLFAIMIVQELKEQQMILESENQKLKDNLQARIAEVEAGKKEISLLHSKVEELKNRLAAKSAEVDAVIKENASLICADETVGSITAKLLWHMLYK